MNTHSNVLFLTYIISRERFAELNNVIRTPITLDTSPMCYSTVAALKKGAKIVLVVMETVEIDDYYIVSTGYGQLHNDRIHYTPETKGYLAVLTTLRDILSHKYNYTNKLLASLCTVLYKGAFPTRVVSVRYNTRSNDLWNTIVDYCTPVQDVRCTHSTTNITASLETQLQAPTSAAVAESSHPSAPEPVSAPVQKADAASQTINEVSTSLTQLLDHTQRERKMTILKDYIKKIKDLDVVRDDSYKKADDELKKLKRKCVEQIDDQITQMAYQILNDTTDRLG